MEYKNPLFRLYSDGSLVAVNSGVRSVKSVRQDRNYKELGRRSKTFEMNSRKARIIRSSAIKQFYKKKYAIHFLTLTFPKGVDEKKANVYLHKFLDNLQTNYKLYSYVVVKEFHKSGSPHFHCLFDLPWTDYRILNNSWNSVFKSDLEFSPNALTRGGRPIVENIQGITKYITKYLSKTYYQDKQGEKKPFPYQSRFYFVSRNVLDRGTLIEHEDFLYLISRYKTEIKTSEYYVLYKLIDFVVNPESFTIFGQYKRQKKRVKKPKSIKKPVPNLSLSLFENPF